MSIKAARKQVKQLCLSYFQLHAGSDSGNETSYQNGSQEGGYDSSSGQQTGYEDAPTGFSNLANQQGNFDNSGQTGGYEHVTEQQAYADAPSQQQGYSADPGSMSNAETSGQGGNNYGSNSGNSSAPAGNTGRTGLQARGEGFGEGFDQGFGQGLSGGPDGSEPHEGVQVQEEVTPDSASRDTDLVSTHTRLACSASHVSCLHSCPCQNAASKQATRNGWHVISTPISMHLNLPS